MSDKPSLQDIEARLTAILQRAKTEIFALDELVMEECFGPLESTIKEVQEEFEVSFRQGEVALFCQTFEAEELAEWDDDTVVEMFSWNADEINEKVISARLGKLNEEDLPAIKKDLKQQLEGELTEEEFDELYFDVKDVGWFPDHHGTLPEEVERPYPNLIVEVSKLDGTDFCVCQELCFFDGASNFSLDELKDKIVAQLSEESE